MRLSRPGNGDFSNQGPGSRAPKMGWGEQDTAVCLFCCLLFGAFSKGPASISLILSV